MVKEEREGGKGEKEEATEEQMMMICKAGTALGERTMNAMETCSDNTVAEGRAKKGKGNGKNPKPNKGKGKDKDKCPIIKALSVFVTLQKKCRKAEYVQRCVCFVNVQSSLHENVIFSVCARMSNAAYIIFIMWNSISGLDTWYHFRFNISCGVAERSSKKIIPVIF